MRAPRRRRMARRGFRAKLLAFLTARGVGLVMVLSLVGGVSAYGFVRGGSYETVSAQHGSLPDLLARALGFGIDSVTITGQKELGEQEILAAAGISSRNSLVFLNVADVREKLMQTPLVREASIRKYYPDRLLIDVTEREPYALWQKDGQVSIVSADGRAIDAMRDARFADLPFVVGEGANEKVGAFLKILEASGDLRSRIRAGVLVSGRRWNLKMLSGLDIKLPETDPEIAVAQLARMAREARLLDKDLLSIDMRVPGRMVVRLSEDAGAQRVEAMAKKPRKGGPT